MTDKHVVIKQSELDKIEKARLDLIKIMEANNIDYPYYHHITMPLYRVANLKRKVATDYAIIEHNMLLRK